MVLKYLLLLFLVVFGRLGLAAGLTCAEINRAAAGSLRAELVADNPEIGQRFLDVLTNRPLAQAIAKNDRPAIDASFEIRPYVDAIRKEVEGLETGMAFSLFRHLHEGRAFAEQENALLALWARSDILYFSPGHGSPGGRVSILGSAQRVEGNELAYVSVKINVDVLGDLVAQTKAAERATAIYYASCNAGLSNTTERGFEASAAERLARQTNRPVVAPNGAIIQLVTVREPLLVYVSVSTTGPDGQKIVLKEDAAFTLFHPDGTSEPISFKAAMAMVARPEAENQYINVWN